MYHKKGIWAVKNRKKIAPKAVQPRKPEMKTFNKKEQRAVIRPRPARTFSTVPRRHPLSSGKTQGTTPLRSSITPGTVLILLAGRYRGRRVIFLKQLASGLLLVTGFLKLNTVPLRRVNQAYVIATNTKVDISSIKIDPKFDDKYFAKPATKSKRKSEAEFFGTEQKKAGLPEAFKADQKAVEGQILPIVKKTKGLKEYLSATFTLRPGQFPHAMKF